MNSVINLFIDFSEEKKEINMKFHLSDSKCHAESNDKFSDRSSTHSWE